MGMGIDEPGSEYLALTIHPLLGMEKTGEFPRRSDSFNLISEKRDGGVFDHLRRSVSSWKEESIHPLD